MILISILINNEIMAGEKQLLGLNHQVEMECRVKGEACNRAKSFLKKEYDQASEQMEKVAVLLEEFIEYNNQECERLKELAAKGKICGTSYRLFCF